MLFLQLYLALGIACALSVAWVRWRRKITRTSVLTALTVGPLLAVAWLVVATGVITLDAVAVYWASARKHIFTTCPQCNRQVLRWRVGEKGWCQHCMRSFDLRHELSDY